MTVDPNADTAKLETMETGIESPRPFSSLVRVDAAGQSHTGKVRLNNEDHFLIGTAGRYLDVQMTSLPKEEAPVHSEEKAYAFVVADGMGGAQGGEVASELAISTLVNLEVEGHTDNVGGEESNQRLSEKRAESVSQLLVSNGLSADSITARGFGETMPIDDNKTPKGRQQNRRVEIIVSGEVIGTKIK